MAKGKGRKAWLVTWEWCGDHAQRNRKIAAVLKPQLSEGRVRELVEFLYLSESEPEEQMQIALGLRPNPYPAKFGEVKGGGATWTGEILCGDNPWLCAQLVDDLLIPATGEPTWKPYPRPIMPTQR